ncbi:hypothetical protein OH492_18955 [Vibrio chagasii]|nr:hypothetical protein [Vibrio chagasii]
MLGRDGETYAVTQCALLDFQLIADTDIEHRVKASDVAACPTMRLVLGNWLSNFNACRPEPFFFVYLCSLPPSLEWQSTHTSLNETY